MSIRTRAMLYTLGIFAAMAVSSFALVAIMELIPQEYYFSIFMAALIAVGLNFVYTVCKAQLEYKAKLEEIAAKK